MSYLPENHITMQFRPDADEKKIIRRHYFRIAWIMLALLFVFNALNQAILYISAGIIGGSFTTEAINSGKKIIASVPVMKAIYSYAFPIAADIAALGTGILITKCDLKKKITFNGFNGGMFWKFTALSFGVVTIGSFINILLLVIIYAVMGKFSDFSLNDAADAANISPQGNPLWLDMLIYLYICLIGPILEELIFRGVLLEGLRKYGNAFGIIMSSILFGLMHQNFMQCIPAICMGFVWGVMTVKSGSLLPSIIVHIFNNSLSAILMIMLSSVGNFDMNNITEFLMNSIPLLAVMWLNVILRLGCIVISAVLVIRFISDKKCLFERSEYCRKRTWTFILTSPPWIIAIAFMIYGTVTSITI